MRRSFSCPQLNLEEPVIILEADKAKILLPKMPKNTYLTKLSISISSIKELRKLLTNIQEMDTTTKYRIKIRVQCLLTSENNKLNSRSLVT